MDSDDELVQQAQRGNMAAFAELVGRHQRFVYNLALRALGRPADAEDTAQEAFVRAWQGLSRFERRARFSTWLYRITANLCYNRRPRLKRELAELELDEEGDLPVFGERELNLEAGDLRAYLHRQISELPERYRMLVLLRYQQELSYEEIAEILSLPLGTVKTGLHRAHARLRRAMQVYEEMSA